MYVLAVDPGNIMSAAVLFDMKARRVEGRWYLLNNDTQRLIVSLLKQKDLGEVQEESILIPKSKRVVTCEGKFPIPDFLAVEMIKCYGMSVGESVFETLVWAGEFIRTFKDNQQKRMELPIYSLVTRVDVKSTLCHSAKSKDKHVREALIDTYGQVGTKKSPGALYGFAGDLFAALGVAHTFTMNFYQYKDLLEHPEVMQEVKDGEKYVPSPWTLSKADGGEIYPERVVDA